MLDLSGGAPLFRAPDLRDGYLRADPRDAAAVMRRRCSRRAISSAPSTSRATSLSTPTSARTPARASSAARAASISVPPAPSRRRATMWRSIRHLRRLRPVRRRLPDGRRLLCAAASRPLMRRLRLLLAAYREAGGAPPVVLLHDERAWRARRSTRWRASATACRPTCCRSPVNEVTQVGTRDDRGGVCVRRRRRCVCCSRQSRATTSPGCVGRWRSPSRSSPGSASAAGGVATIETDDPDALGDALRATRRRDRPRTHPASFAAVGEQARRPAAGAARTASRRTGAGRRHRAARRARRSAPSRSTSTAARLCLACVSACPTGALTATIPSGRCCASTRMPACSAGCARRRAPRR